MSDVVALVILLGGMSTLLASLLYARALLTWRRENRENYLLHERAMQAIRDESLTADERNAIVYEYRDTLTSQIERHYFGKKGRPKDEEPTLADNNRELREENARLRAELSSRR